MKENKEEKHIDKKKQFVENSKQLIIKINNKEVYYQIDTYVNYKNTLTREDLYTILRFLKTSAIELEEHLKIKEHHPDFSFNKEDLKKLRCF
jgi:hypothetical protein